MKLTHVRLSSTKCYCASFFLAAPAAAMAAAPGGAPAVGAGKSEITEFVDSKTSFGDKQKPLYHMPLKWRKLVGKPQVLHRGFRRVAPFFS